MPRVPMGVDQAGSDDMAGGVDYFSVDVGYGGCDSDDTSVLDEDVSLREISDLGIHRNNMAAANKNSLHSGCSLINTCRSASQVSGKSAKAWMALASRLLVE